MKKGLDNREQDKNGDIREKNGASIIGNLTSKYPELKIFNQKSTLTKVKKQTKQPSLDQVRKFAKAKIRSEK